MSTFINFIDDPEWGSYYELTSPGYAAVVVIMILTILVAAIIVGRRQQSGGFNARKLAFAGIALALAFITSYIKFEWFMGGSVTLFSMFFICLIGYTYGINIGLVTAFAYSLLQFVQSGGSYFLTPFQVCCDYFFAFTALGIAGFWFKKNNGLIKGFIFACLARGLFHTIGGYMYWMDYMPEWWPASISGLYSICYNYSYILSEMILTIIILQIPAVKKAVGDIVRTAQD